MAIYTIESLIRRKEMNTDPRRKIPDFTPKKVTIKADRTFTAIQWVEPYYHPEVCNIMGYTKNICDLCGCPIEDHGLIVDIDGITKYVVCPDQWIVRDYMGTVFIMRDDHFRNFFDLEEEKDV